MIVVTWSRKPSRKRSTMIPQCKITCSVRLSVRTLAFHAGKEGFDSPTEYHCFYSQASIRYRVWTHTLFGSQRPATDPDITASALERKHRTPKLAFSVLDYKNLVLKCSWTHDGLSRRKSGDRYPLRPPSLKPQRLDTSLAKGTRSCNRGFSLIEMYV